MAAYRCVLLGLNREVETIEEIDALTKRGALKIARATLQRSPALWAFELWRGKSCSIGRPRHHRSRAKVPPTREPTQRFSISGTQPTFW